MNGQIYLLDQIKKKFAPMENSLEDLRICELTEISVLTELYDGKTVRLRGWVNTIRSTRYVTFISLRESLDTIQCVAVNPNTDEEDVLNLKSISIESFIEVEGKIKCVKSAVKGCTKKSIEVDVLNLNIISRVTDTLPFSLKDAAATEKERMLNQGICKVGYNLRLDNRFLDFRMPQTLSIIRVTDSVMTAFRGYLRTNNFIEIKTTKIIQSGSEGGSNLFTMNYFGKTAYLAQSPQLFKQMVIAGGLKRVYEVGHVYRAEQSNTNRYLSEFTGLDIEMEMTKDYKEVIGFIYKIFIHIFQVLKDECKRELEIIREYKNYKDLEYGEDPVIITHSEAIKLLRANGVEIGDNDDFNREVEKKLGGIIKEERGVDLFVVINNPAAERAFYTYVNPETGESHSYNFIMRGEEILSGAQRVIDPAALRNAIEQRDIDPSSIGFYLDSFKFGVPPHAGCGIGLERLLKSYFDFEDIRYCSLYPRDPNRINP